MAICASCGAASAEGALACASCWRPLVPPPVLPPPPPSAPPVPPAGAPSLTKPAAGTPGPPDLPPPVLPPPPLSAPTAGGPWGAGRPYDPAGDRPAALARLTGADWRPALRATVAPTAVLLLAALVTAVPENHLLTGSFDTPSFGKRFGSALAMALAALGAPYRLDFEVGGPAVATGDSGSVFRALPMTVTVLWLLALWLGLKVGARRRQQRTGEQQTRRQAAGEAVRTAVAAAVVTLLVGLVGGANWHPGGGRFDLDDPAAARLLARTTYSSSAGWLEAVGWTALLAGLLAFAVYGTDALRWAAWRNRAVRGWAVAGLAAGRALAVSVALAAVVGFVVVAVEVDGDLTGAALAFLPNLGLLLLGLGSGATFRASSTSVLNEEPDWPRDPRDVDEFSLFDLQDASADWRWAVLLAVASAAVLGWTAYRRRLDAADRLRLSAVYAAGLSLLMLVAGMLVSTTSVFVRGGTGRDSGFENTLSLVPWTLLVANAVWAAVGALAVPPLLAARDRRSAAPADPADPGPDPGSGASGAEFTDGTPMVVEVIDSADGQRSGPPPTGGAPDGDGPVDPSVWSRRA